MWALEDAMQGGKQVPCMNRHEELNAEYGKSNQVKGRKTKVLNNQMREREKGRSCSVGGERNSVQVGLRSAFQLGTGLLDGECSHREGNNLVGTILPKSRPHTEDQLEVLPKGALGVC